MFDIGGFIYDPNGIDVEVLKGLKDVNGKKVFQYPDYVKTATYTEGSKGIWNVKCDMALLVQLRMRLTVTTRAS